MLTLADALSERFPSGDTWTSAAVASLGISVESDVAVREVSAGWTRSTVGAGDDPTLFVLLSDRIGCGRSTPAPHQPQWISLSAITALEGIDEEHTALDTVEVHVGGTVLVVGWSPAFCAAVVDALSQQHRPVVATDPSPLDGLAPSEWTEPPVAAAAAPPPPPAWAIPDAQPASTLPGPEDVATDRAVSSDSGDSGGTEPGPTGPAGPWLARSMVWPDPLRGVAYVGGHPEHSRRRKNGSLTFGPFGWVIEGGGFTSWRIEGEWNDVEHVSIQNAEELEFCEGLKIDAASSALSIQLVDGSQIFVEIRMRRPPSLRATLAPVLLMAESIPAWRTEWEQHLGAS